jgi:hypothetical protein
VSPIQRTVVFLAAFALAAPAASRAADPGAARLGVQLDAGFPGGAAAALAWRPIPQLRLDAGLTYDLVGVGVRAGATLVPWRLAVSPSLRVQAGHTFEGDAGNLVGHFTTLTSQEQQALAKVSYDHLALLAGIELGDPDRVVFFVRGGIAWLWATAGGFDPVARAADSQVISAADPSARVRTLAVGLGVLFFVW